MMSGVTGIVFLLIPVIVTIAYRIIRAKFFAKRKNILMYLLFPVLLVSLYGSTHFILGATVLPYLLLGLAALGMGLTIYQAYHDGDILFTHFFTQYVNFSFIITGIWYIVLLIVEIIVLITQ